MTLLEKIRQGKFELSHHIKNADYYAKLAQKLYQQTLESDLIADYSQRVMEAELTSRSERLKSQRSLEKGIEMEAKILQSLRESLEKEFGVDLWDKAMKTKKGRGTTEDLYMWYKKQVGQTYTKSELKMRGIL
jgi:hypothetical protein